MANGPTGGLSGDCYAAAQAPQEPLLLSTSSALVITAKCSGTSMIAP